MKPNEHGVFMDAERIEIFRKKDLYAEVRIAFADGRFHWGYDMRHSTGGCSGGASVRHWCRTRNEAILSALRVLANSLCERDRDAASRAMLREVERQIERLTPRQLDLFGVFA